MVALALAEVLAGVILRENVELLVAFPALLILAPGLMDLRGNVYGAIGYRLVKALHLGLAESRVLSRFNLINMLTGFVVSVAATLFLVLIGLCLTIVLGLRAPDLISLCFIALQSTIIVYILLTPVVVSSIVYLFKKGYDPSPFVATIVTGIGDVLTPATMILVAYLHGMVPYGIKLILVIVLIVLAFTGAHYIYRVKGMKDLFENLTSSVIASTGSSLGGLSLALIAGFIEGNPEILGLIPAFNAVIGAAMGYLGSSLNIHLHVSGTSPGRVYNRDAVAGLASSYLSIMLAVLLSLAPFHIVFNKSMKVVLVASISSVSVYVLASTITYILTKLTFKNGWDPDNVVFPVMTTFVDLVGPLIVSLMAILVL
ncbi:MAG: magnesium transporter [Desulfurococcaceae archaeon]